MPCESIEDRHRSHSPAAPRTRRTARGLSFAAGVAIAKLIVISGPSGAGKGTLIQRVLPFFDGLQVSVSATTRGRRAGERTGVEYFFLSREEFLRRVEQGRFLEWAEYGGNLYGTPAEPVEAALCAGNDVILEIEVQGARQIMRRFPEAVVVFIRPPDLEELEERLRNRKTESESDIGRRMAHAEEELEQFEEDARSGGREFDYAIVNDDLEAAAQELWSVIESIRSLDSMR